MISIMACRLNKCTILVWSILWKFSAFAIYKPKNRLGLGYKTFRVRVKDFWVSWLDSQVMFCLLLSLKVVLNLGSQKLMSSSVWVSTPTKSCFQSTTDWLSTAWLLFVCYIATVWLLSVLSHSRASPEVCQRFCLSCATSESIQRFCPFCY